jgi:hypothetical protein
MSNALFPTFPGLAWSVFKTPEWNTSRSAVSGKEVRMANRARPVWLFSLSYEVLRGASVQHEYQKLTRRSTTRARARSIRSCSTTPATTPRSRQPIGTGDGVTTFAAAAPD